MKALYSCLVILCFLQAAARTAHAEESDEEISTIGESIDDSDDDDGETGDSSLGLGGWVEFRPSVQTESRALHAENEAALQWGFNDNFYVGYTQEFRFEYLGNGYAWADFTDLMKVGPFSLGYEPRVYAPTSSLEKKAGFNVATRQYLKSSWTLNRTASLFFWEVPILSSYKQAGYEEDEELFSNPWFENRIELGLRLSFFDDRLKIRLPLILQSVRHSDFDEEAANNASWVHTMWIYPEATFQVADNTLLGAGYYSEALMDDKLQRGNVGDGIRRGVFQFIVQQSL